MKAVLARSVAPGRVIDLAHDLPAHGVAEGAFLFREMARAFPPGTVHVVVVDPGVGGRRAPIAIECADGSVVVGPDNGVLYPFVKERGLRRAVRLDPTSRARPPRVGATFDGRDVFAPAAAKLLNGTPLVRLGPPIEPRPLDLPRPVRSAGGVRGEVLHVDRFGNLITNLPSDWRPATARGARGRLAGEPRCRLPYASSYEGLGAGRAGLLASSFGLLEISVDRGRADARFRAGVGSRVELEWVTGVRARATLNSARTRPR